MSKKLTARQEQIFNFIKEFIELNGYPPTYREIGKEFDISSTFGVKRHIDALIKKGFLENESNSNRAISIIGHNNKELTNNSFEIPIIGRVAAGFPILAEENVEGTISIDNSLIKHNSKAFALKVRGDSMIKAGILDEDIVIVNSQSNALNGEIIIALLGDEATCKRFQIKGNKYYLIPENDNYPIIPLNNRNDFSIIGKVVGVFRSYN